MKLFGTQLCVVYVAMPASTGKQRAVFGSKQPGWFKDREFRRQTQKKNHKQRANGRTERQSFSKDPTYNLMVLVRQLNTLK